jgi:hypothetical protein
MSREREYKYKESLPTYAEAMGDIEQSERVIVVQNESDSDISWSSICSSLLIVLIIIALFGGVAYYYLKNAEKDNDDDDDNILTKLVEEVNISKDNKKDINVDNTVDSTKDSTITGQNTQTANNVVTSSDSTQGVITTLDCDGDAARAAATTYLMQINKDYTIAPLIFNRASDTECDVKFNFVPVDNSQQGSQPKTSGTDSRRLVYNLNPFSVNEDKGAMSGQTTMNMGDSIYDCNTDTILKAAKTYYEAKMKKTGLPTYTAILISGTPVQTDKNLQCDIKLQHSLDGSQQQSQGGTTETHRFTFARNVDNEWEVVGSAIGDVFI